MGDLIKVRVHRCTSNLKALNTMRRADVNVNYDFTFDISYSGWSLHLLVAGIVDKHLPHIGTV